MNTHQQTPELADNDDLPIGRILSRREVLALFGAAGSVLLVAGCAPVQPPGQPVAEAMATVEATTISATVEATVEATAAEAANTALPSCVVRPELTEGPYFVDEMMNRSDIRINSADGAVSAGIPFLLTFAVSQVSNNACTPLAGAQVDIWHCDAYGEYSGVTDNAEGFTTVGQDFLRGYQVTDAGGLATFTTVYPGWYRGRAVHIHFKIRVPAAENQIYEFTSQLFFDDAFSDQLYAQKPYASKGQRDRLNSTDNIYQESGGQLLLVPTAANDGYAATFAIALDLADEAVGQSDSGQGGPGGPGGRRGSGG